MIRYDTILANDDEILVKLAASHIVAVASTLLFRQVPQADFRCDSDPNGDRGILGHCK